MVWVDRVTFIHPDGKTEKVDRAQVVYSGEMPLVKIDLRKSPSWIRVGADAVAAHADGSVETAFTIGQISTESHPTKATGRSPRQYRVFRP